MAQVRQEFASDLRQLAGMRAAVRAACTRAWGEAYSDALAALELALTEAAANIIRHAHSGERGQSIELTIDADADAVCVRLNYFGEAFDPGAVAAPSFDGSREGGFGVFLIRASVDEVRYGRDDAGRCEVRLLKRRS